MLVILKKSVLNFLDKKVCTSLWQLATFFKVRIKSKKRHPIFRIQLITMCKTICRIRDTKRNRKRKK